ncbi:hypothetical protein ACFLU6_09845 [Acidobacteriota bacterium]
MRLESPKVLMHLPFRQLYTSFEQAIGAIREDFFCEMMQMSGLAYHYLKSSRGAKTPDFLVNSSDGDIIVEIGGKSKGRRQFKGVTVERKLILAHSAATKESSRPLFLLGYTA